ncbi:MAG TPA: hypothetical protein VH089_18110 [Streptosporangiaceae bacterium]|nr:hypothetical protein [Streptosporangiaceae bacterium]
MTEPTGPVDPLLVCAPLRFEARAVRRGLRDSARAAGSSRRAARRGAPEVLRTGYGAAKATARAAELETGPFATMAVMGTGAGLAPELNPGDLIVGTEVVTVRDGRPDPDTVVRVPSSPLLLGELRRAGLTARAGRIGTVERLVRGDDRAKLAEAGLIAADLESAALAAAAQGRPLAVIRAVSDTPGRPLLHPGLVSGGLAALRSLRAAGPVLDRWAAACGERQVLLAGPRSFCAGVERAIEIVERVLEQRG